MVGISAQIIRMSYYPIYDGKCFIIYDNCMVCLSYLILSSVISLDGKCMIRLKLEVLSYYVRECEADKIGDNLTRMMKIEVYIWNIIILLMDSRKLEICQENGHIVSIEASIQAKWKSCFMKFIECLVKFIPFKTTAVFFF